MARPKATNNTSSSGKRKATLVTSSSLTPKKQASITSFFATPGTASASRPRTAPLFDKPKPKATPKATPKTKATPKSTPKRRAVDDESGSEFEAPDAASDGEGSDFSEAAPTDEDEDVVMGEESEVEEVVITTGTKKKKTVVKPKKRDPIPSGIQVKDANLQAEDLPPLSDVQEIFMDIVRRVPALKGVAEHLGDRKLRVGTMCSGTESPLLALGMISRSMKETYGVTIEVEHLFSCEIEPFKQAYIERNFRPPILFRDITELGRAKA